jgi:glycosyltransferase involved in cell wall biosynthesis
VTPQVSVVMAAKNYARFIGQAVESVRAQTLTDWELVVVDDGSTDGTAAALAPYRGDSRVRYVPSDKLGQSRAKNLGARLARAAVVAYLDADDAWRPTKLEKQLAALVKDDRVGVVSTGRAFLDDAGTVAPDRAAAPPSGDVRAALYSKNFVCFSSVMLRKQVLDHVGGFDPSLDLAIDYDLWQRVAAHYHFAHVAEPLTLYRTGHGNLSARLADRVATAERVMTRALVHRDLARHLPAGVAGEGYASTFRTLAYALKSCEPLAAARLYGRALAAGRPFPALKGLLGVARACLRGRTPSVGPNATANR